MKFLAGLLTGAAVGIAVFATVVTLAVGHPMVETRGFAAAFEQKDEIALGIAEPKVIFAGGSSVDLGISAELAQTRLGCPAVNMGLISPLGAEYLTDKVKQVAKPGDTVVLALEYYCYAWPGLSALWLDPMFVQFITAQDPDYLRKLSSWYRWNILARVKTAHIATALLRSLGERKRETPGNMNNFGDRIDNTPERRPMQAVARTRPLAQLVDGLGASPKGFPAVSAFVAWAKKNNIKVIAAFPNIARNAAYKDEVLTAVEEQIVQFYSSLDVPIAGTLRGAMFGEEDCYDTAYHLVTPAVERRTQKLVDDISQKVESRKTGKGTKGGGEGKGRGFCAEVPD